jgi:hypothetical protein
MNLPRLLPIALALVPAANVAADVPRPNVLRILIDDLKPVPGAATPQPSWPTAKSAAFS